MRKAVLVLTSLSLGLLFGCATSHTRMDTPEANASIKAYNKCVTIWTWKYSNIDLEPVDIANASVNKCEPQLSQVKTVIRKQADIGLEQGSTPWVEMMQFAETETSDTRSKAISRSLEELAQLKIRSHTE